MWYLITIPNQNRVGIVVIKVQVLLELDFLNFSYPYLANMTTESTLDITWPECPWKISNTWKV